MVIALCFLYSQCIFVYFLTQYFPPFVGFQIFYKETLPAAPKLVSMNRFRNLLVELVSFSSNTAISKMTTDMTKLHDPWNTKCGATLSYILLLFFTPEVP